MRGCLHGKTEAREPHPGRLDGDSPGDAGRLALAVRREGRFAGLWSIAGDGALGCGLYGAIAKDGYFDPPGEQSPVAYFPLYPLAISGLMALGVNRWVAGACLSLIFGLCAILAVLPLGPPRQSVSRRHRGLALDSVPVLHLPLRHRLFRRAVFVVRGGRFRRARARAPTGGRPPRCPGDRLPPGRPRGGGGAAGEIDRAATAAGPRSSVGGFAPRAGRAGPPRVDVVPRLALRRSAGLHSRSERAWLEPAAGLAERLKVEWFRIMSGASPLVAFRLGGHALVTFVALALGCRPGSAWASATGSTCS